MVLCLCMLVLEICLGCSLAAGTGSTAQPPLLLIPVKRVALENGWMDISPALFIFHLFSYLAVEHLPMQMDAPVSPGIASP